MPQKKSYTYEAMFLLSQSVAADLGGAIDHIKEVLARGQAEIIALRKWDERRLAYEIKGQKRGYYVLVYFKAQGDMLAHIERDCNLSEKILRTMFLRADHMTLEEMQAADGRREMETEIKLRASQMSTGAQGAQPGQPSQPAGEPETAEAQS